MDHLPRIILYVFLFLASVAALIAQSPRAGQKTAWLSLTIALFVGVVVGAAMGALVGTFSPIPHGTIAGAAGFAVAGFFGGMIVALLRNTAHSGADAQSPSMVTVAGIAVGGGVGALVGLWLPVFIADVEAPFMLSFVGALLGVLAGALLGLAYEKPLVGGPLVGLFLLASGAGVGIAWLEDANTARPENSATSSPSAPQPTIWDRMYDGGKLRAALSDGESEASLLTVPTLWLLLDGGPQFYRPEQPEGATLRETFARQESYAGAWVSDIAQPDKPLQLQFDFADDTDECTLTVSGADGVISVYHGTMKVNGAEVTFRTEGGTLSANFSGYRPK